MNVGRRGFLGLTTSAVAWAGGCAYLAPAGSSKGKTLRAKFGIISDIHLNGMGDAWTYRHALEYFRAAKVDGVIIPGDMASNGSPATLKCVSQIWFDVFPNGRRPEDGEPVEHIFVSGNHDAYDWAREANCKQVWQECFHEEFQPSYLKIVKGFPFVGRHWGFPMPSELLAEAARKVDAATPFFFIQHKHPGNTCYGPWAWGSDNEKCDSPVELKKYPNVIAFSGHSHYSLTDERSIWQGAFTSIGCGSLKYGCIPAEEYGAKGVGKMYNGLTFQSDVYRHQGLSGSILPQQGMVMSIYEDRIVFERRDFNYNASLGDDWVIPLPCATEKPYVFETRAQSYPIPEFPAGAKLNIVKVEERTDEKSAKKWKRSAPESYEKLTLQIPPATVGACMMYRLQIELEDGSIFAEHREADYNWHFPPAFATKNPIEYVSVAFELPQEKKFRFRVAPHNCYGRLGKEIVSDWTHVAAPRARA